MLNDKYIHITKYFCSRYIKKMILLAMEKIVIVVSKWSLKYQNGLDIKIDLNEIKLAKIFIVSTSKHRMYIKLALIVYIQN